MRKALVALWSLLISATACGAMVLHVPLSEMVADAQLIVLGKVVDITTVCDPCDTPNRQATYQATLGVTETLKGPSTSRVDVFFMRGDPSPEFLIGRTYIVLLRQWKSAFVVVNGYAGKLDVDGNLVRRIFAPGEAADQPLDTVLSRIRSQ